MQVIHQLCYAHLIQLCITDTIYKNKDNSNNETENNEEVVQEEDQSVDGDDLAQFLEDESVVDDDLGQFLDDNNLNGESEKFIEFENHLITYLNLEDDSPIRNNNLIVNNEYKDVIQSVRKVVVFFRRSSNRLNALKIHTDLNPLLDSDIKWKSLYAMLSRFEVIFNSIKKAVCDLEEDETDKKSIGLIKSISETIKSIDKLVLKSMVKSFSILNFASNILSESNCNLERAIKCLDYAQECLDLENNYLANYLSDKLKVRRVVYETRLV